MKAVVGQPNEKVVGRDGKEIVVRDDLGLTLDPAAWGNQKCKTCYGRGMVIVAKPVTKAEIAELAADNERDLANVTITNKVKGSGLYRSGKPCVCSGVRYKKMRRFVADQIAKNKVNSEIPTT